MAAPSISSLDVSRVSTRGGEVVTATGEFTVGAAHRAYFGPNGDVTDEPCFFGPGLGYASDAESATEMEVIAPPMDVGVATAMLTIEEIGVSSATSSAIDVVEHMYSNVLYEVRKGWPRDFNTGARDLNQEPWQ